MPPGEAPAQGVEVRRRRLACGHHRPQVHAATPVRSDARVGADPPGLAAGPRRLVDGSAQAPGDGTRRARACGGVDERAGRRGDPVGADDEVTGSCVGGVHGHAGPDGPGGQGGGEHAQQVGAVEHEDAVAVPADERGVVGAHEPPPVPVPDPAGLVRVPDRPDVVAHPQRVERPQRVRPERDARALVPRSRPPLADLDVPPRPAQGDRRRETADATADHQRSSRHPVVFPDRSGRHVLRRHSWSPRVWSVSMNGADGGGGSILITARAGPTG